MRPYQYLAPDLTHIASLTHLFNTHCTYRYCDASHPGCTACTDVSDCGYCDAAFDYGVDSCAAIDSDGTISALTLDGLCDEPRFSIGTTRCVNGTDASDCAVCDELLRMLQFVPMPASVKDYGGDCGHGRCRYYPEMGFAGCECDNGYETDDFGRW